VARPGLSFCASLADPAEMAARYGAGTSVLYWRQRLVCSRCGKREVDMVVSGTDRRY
jgi:hypothetical protein